LEIGAKALTQAKHAFSEATDICITATSLQNSIQKQLDSFTTLPIDVTDEALDSFFQRTENKWNSFTADSQG